MSLKKGVKTETTFPNSFIYTLSDGWSGLIVIAENLDPYYYFQIEIQAGESTNMVSTRQSLFTYDSVPPLRKQVLMVLTHFEASCGYKIYYALKFKTTSNEYFNYNNQRLKNYPEITKYVFGLHTARPL